jgi:hypothetical protein
MTQKPIASLASSEASVHLKLDTASLPDEVLAAALERALQAIPGATRFEQVDAKAGEWKVQLRPEASLPGMQRWVDHLMRARLGPYEN